MIAAGLMALVVFVSGAILNVDPENPEIATTSDVVKLRAACPFRSDEGDCLQPAPWSATGGNAK